jgi:hypothetical protein
MSNLPVEPEFEQAVHEIASTIEPFLSFPLTTTL